MSRYIRNPNGVITVVSDTVFEVLITRPGYKAAPGTPPPPDPRYKPHNVSAKGMQVYPDPEPSVSIPGDEGRPDGNL